MMDLVWCFIAAIWAGIFIALVGIERDLREIDKRIHEVIEVMWRQDDLI